MAHGSYDETGQKGSHVLSQLEQSEVFKGVLQNGDEIHPVSAPQWPTISMAYEMRTVTANLNGKRPTGESTSIAAKALGLYQCFYGLYRRLLWLEDCYLWTI